MIFHCNAFPDFPWRGSERYKSFQIEVYWHRFIEMVYVYMLRLGMDSSKSVMYIR